MCIDESNGDAAVASECSMYCSLRQYEAHDAVGRVGRHAANHVARIDVLDIAAAAEGLELRLERFLQPESDIREHGVPARVCTERILREHILAPCSTAATLSCQENTQMTKAEALQN